MYRQILLAYDGSEAAKQALLRTSELALAASAKVHVIAVGRLPEYAETQEEVEEAREQAEAFYAKRLDEAASRMREGGIEVTATLAYGKPSVQILRLAEEVHADLIVIGVHPHHPLRRRLLGGTADKVVDQAECSVLVVR